MLPRGRAGDLNQALMDLGAMICTPSNPQCLICPLFQHCRASTESLQTELPFPATRSFRPHRDVTAGVIWDENGHVLITQRPLDGLLGGLWEFPGGKRLPGETLAAEKPLPATAAVATPWLLGLALLALALAELGLGLDPGADLTAWLPVVVGLPVAVAGWCGLWALLSKVFQHRFDFAGHLRITLPWMLAVQLTDALLPQLAASLGWPWLWRLAAPVQVLLFALWLREHMVHVLPAYRRTVTAAVAAVALAGSAISLSFIHRATDSYSRAPYMSTLPLPATRLAGTVPPSVLVQDMARLADPLAARAKKAREEDEDDGAADEE